MTEFHSMGDFHFAGKTVLVRVDVNSPIKNGVVQENPRIVEHAKTIKELSDKNARVIVLAHQGRAGDDDFTTLEQHANLLSKFVGRKVKYVDDVLGSHAQDSIKKLSDGKIVLLENLRMLAEETLDAPAEKLAKTIMVQKLSALAQLFVNDAFSAAHRAQTSLVGFTETLPSCAGRIMEREYAALQKATQHASHPCVYVLAGAKPEEDLGVMKHGFETKSVDFALTAGILGQLFLAAKGIHLGKTKEAMEQAGQLKELPAVKELLAKYGERIMVPIDLAYAQNGERIEVLVEDVHKAPAQVFDIGSATAQKYADTILDAKTVYVKGPCGKFEDPLFEKGTRIVFKAVEKSGAFSLVGGGHTLTAMEQLGISKKKISHISLGGGVLLEYLAGKPLPAIEALKKNKQKFHAH